MLSRGCREPRLLGVSALVMAGALLIDLLGKEEGQSPVFGPLAILSLLLSAGGLLAGCRSRGPRSRGGGGRRRPAGRGLARPRDREGMELLRSELVRRGLSRQERRLVLDFFEGLTMKEISSRRRIADSTVRNTFRSVYRKLGLPGQAELAAFGARILAGAGGPAAAEAARGPRKGGS